MTVAPWFAPQFANIRYSDMQNIIRSERLTLASLPRLCAALNRKVTVMLRTARRRNAIGAPAAAFGDNPHE